jgi:uncharacterized protein YhaN
MNEATITLIIYASKETSMAALTVFTNLPPCWVNQDGHWRDNNSTNSQYRSISNEAMNANLFSSSLETNVLVNILSVLKRMDSKMELQAERLATLEVTRSPRSTSSSDATAFSESTLSKGQSSGRTTIVSEAEDGEDSNEYLPSVSKLKSRFLAKASSLVDDERPGKLCVPEEADAENIRSIGN